LHRGGEKKHSWEEAMTTQLARIGIALLACAALVSAAAPVAQAQEKELRIGFIAPMTGPFAQVGRDMLDGLNMYLEEVKGEFAGAKVRVIVEDSQAKPDTAVTRAKKLTLQDKVHILLGGVLATEGYALAPVSTADKTVYVASVPAADDLTQRDLKQYPYFIRTGWAGSQPHHALGAWACEQGHKKVVTIAADYAFGHESVGGFQKAFEDCGGQVIQKVWPPLGSKDFGPFIPGIKAEADAVFTLMVGPMVIQFPKQLRQSGYKKPILGGGTSYDEFALPFMGDEVIGDVSALQYSAALDTPKNAAFVKAYRSKYGKVPSYFSETNYTSAQMIHEVLKGTKGSWPGAEPFIKAMAALKIDAVRGPVAFDDMRNPVHNIYIKKVEKKPMFGYDKPELWNTVIKTYPNVSQFWTYGKDAFLKQPVYSRDFPPCKFCN
jgi:branched-chain amino acid transport system substrate-binding protein